MRKIFITLILMLSVFSIANAHPFKSEKELDNFFSQIDKRIKEELRFGNSIRNSIDSGFNKGFIAIFDSNLTTLIITTILFVFGTGPIKGFAVTLALGTLASMFTAITATKVLLLTFVNMFGFRSPKLFGVTEEEVK